MQNIFSTKRVAFIEHFESHNIHIVSAEILALKRMCDRESKREKNVND